MRRLYYSSGSVLTGDALSAAVLGYARALADTGKADIIEIPVVAEAGASGNASFLIGPSSQLCSVPAASEGDDPADDAIVEDLRAKTRALQPSRPTAQTNEADGAVLEDFEIA